jgi:hypothetical protein
LQVQGPEQSSAAQNLQHVLHIQGCSGPLLLPLAFKTTSYLQSLNQSLLQTPIMRPAAQKTRWEERLEVLENLQ